MGQDGIGFGWVRDGEDEWRRMSSRLSYAATIGRGSPWLPEGCSMEPCLPPVSSQGHTSRCTGFAFRDAWDTARVARYGRTTENRTSANFAYALGRAKAELEERGVISKFSLSDEGAMLYWVVWAANAVGVASESSWGDGEAETNDWPSFDAIVEARSQVLRPSNWRRIHEEGARRVLAVRQAIAQSSPVLFGTPVSEAFCTKGHVEDVWMPPTDEAGGHAMFLYGYARLPDGSFAFLGRNSWGEDWGGGAIVPGYGKLPPGSFAMHETWLCDPRLHDLTILSA